MGLTSLVYLGSYHETCEANINLVDIFKKSEKEKHPKQPFYHIRQVAIEAPPKTELKINDVDIVMPSTGIIELGLDFILIDSLIFKSPVEVNIVYMY